MKINSVSSVSVAKTASFSKNNTDSAGKNNVEKPTTDSMNKSVLQNKLIEAECRSFMLRDNYANTGNEADFERYVGSLIEADDVRRSLYLYG